jgi:hypothetical protein
MMNWKGLGRERSWLNLKLLSRHLPGGTEENKEKNSVRIAGLQTEICALDLPNTKQDFYHSTTRFDFI